MTTRRLVTLRKNVYPGIQTATTRPRLVTRQKRQGLVTLQRLVTLRKDVHPGTTSPGLVKRRKNQRVVTLQRLVTLRTYMHLDIHTAMTSPRGVPRQKRSAWRGVAAFSDAQKRCAPRRLHGHVKYALSDTSNSQRLMTLQRLVTLRKMCTPARQVRVYLVVRQKSQRVVALQGLVALRKFVHLGIHTVTTSLR